MLSVLSASPSVDTYLLFLLLIILSFESVLFSQVAVNFLKVCPINVILSPAVPYLRSSPEYFLINHSPAGMSSLPEI